MSILLIADDEPVILEVLGKYLAAPGRTVLLAPSAAEARLLARASGPVDVALLDRHLGDGSGLEVARALKADRPETEVILLTAYGQVDTAVEALTSLLEPLMMVFLGGSIGAILIAMYLPIFKLAENIK